MAPVNFVICLFLGLILSLPVQGADNFPISIVHRENSETDRYCGLYCVYQAAKLTGRQADLESLIVPERLSGDYGSTPRNLTDTLDEYHIPYRYLNNIDYADAYLMGGPIILLIKNAPESHEPNHWIMLLDVRLGDCDIYDPSTGTLTVSAAELRSLWGGTAIAVGSSQDVLQTSYWSSVIVKGMVCLGLILAGIGLLRLLATRYRFVGLVLATLVLAIAHQTLMPSSFARNRDVLSALDHAGQPREPAAMTPEELIHYPGKLHVIDVRTPPQYHAEHVAGSVSIPIGSSQWKIRKLMSKIPKDAPIVFYCNSRSCGWSEAFAKFSVLHQYTNLHTLPEGIVGYASAGGKLESGRPKP